MRLSRVLIPSEQGKCSNGGGGVFKNYYKRLNPFGTGKVFKHIKIWRW